MQVRERIETSGRDARWEFNKGTLFSCSNYMAEVCGNLMEMVEVVDDFFKFLGPELKAVTGETAYALRSLHAECACRQPLGTALNAPVTLTSVSWPSALIVSASRKWLMAGGFGMRLTQVCLASACAGDTKGIDDIIERVQSIVEPVETVMFDVFDQAHAPQWRALRARFFADNEEVKAATRELIDTSFRKLRSAEGAFDLLQVGPGGCLVELLPPQPSWWDDS
jgi:hypothetical protein